MLKTQLQEISKDLVEPVLSLDDVFKACFNDDRFQASLLLCANEDGSFKSIASNGIPSSPFNGAESDSINQVIEACFSQYPKPHVHSIKGLMLSQRIKRLQNGLTVCNRVLFYPFLIKGFVYIVIGMLAHDAGKMSVDDEIHSKVKNISASIKGAHLLELLEKRTSDIELYVKEVGHDLASSVQAIIPKLRNARTGRLPSPLLQRKLQESENEILSMYRNAESLGIVVDQNYQVGEFHDIDLVDMLQRVRDLYIAEAEEKNITIKLQSERSCPYLGDKQALEIAVGHFVLNAIKYSSGDSRIQIDLKINRDSIYITVLNKSNIPLPDIEEEHYIWDFGYRGEKAKETHVNGSGIGLFTSRKIAIAHFGSTSYTRKGKLAIFRILLPTLTEIKRLSFAFK